MRDLPSGTVTFLFTDVEGSTKLLHELGADDYAQELAEHRRVLRLAFNAHDGVEVDTQGDAFFVAFGTAADALEAAGEALAGLAAGPIRVRIGIHTGTPYVAEEGYVGVDVHRAARIAACGHGGQILISAATAALLDMESLVDLGDHRLKDLSAPERIYQLGDEHFPPLKSLHQTNLPITSTPFLGRKRELGEVLGLLSQEDLRLVTLTGAGGTGKTRLGLQVAAELAGRYPHGVWWVPLAAIRDPELVLATAGQTLGSKNGLEEHIADRSMLLLFDNFEHVVEAGAHLAGLLASCPRLELLVTSREPLHVTGEQEYPVPPLVHEEGVGLFVARARAVKPDFHADDAVSQICRRLDDLPLALELAATRVKALSPAQILARLERRLPLLTRGPRDLPERQRTLLATIEWSHELLIPAEKLLFARLAVFTGGCTFEAAEAVAQADLDTVQSLVDKSLVRHTGERLWMLETIREYAEAQLERGPDATEIRAGHARLFNGIAAAAGHLVGAAGTIGVAEILETEHANIRGALRWALDNGAQDDALAAAGGIWRFWELRGHAVEGMRWLDEILGVATSPTAVRLEALRGAVALARQLGLSSRAQSLAEEMLALARSVNDDRMTGIALALLGTIAFGAEGIERAVSYFEAAAEILRRTGDDLSLGHVMNHLSYTALGMRDFPRAAEYAQESLEIAARVGDAMGKSIALANLGLASLLDDADSDAEAFFIECLTHSYEIGYEDCVAYGFEGLAAVAVRRGNAPRAAWLLGAADVLRETVGTQLDWVERAVHEDVVAQVRGLLTPDALASEWASGHDAPRDDAMAYAVGRD